MGKSCWNLWGSEAKTKKSTVVIILAIIVAAVVTTFVLTLAFTAYISWISLLDTRGLEVFDISQSGTAKLLAIKNIGSKPVCFVGFYNENGSYLRIYNASYVQQMWAGSYYVLPSGQFVTLIQCDQVYYAKSIYVLFSDGYKVKIYG